MEMIYMDREEKIRQIEKTIEKYQEAYDLLTKED